MSRSPHGRLGRLRAGLRPFFMAVCVGGLLGAACSAGGRHDSSNGPAAPAADPTIPVGTGDPIATALSGAAATAGASPDAAPSRSPANGASTAGELLITRDRTLALRDLQSGNERTLFTAPEGAFVSYPVWAPDGRRFAFAVETPFSGTPGADWGSDLYLAEQPGAAPRRVWEHTTPGAEVDSLQWVPDGTALLFAEARLSYDTAGDVQGQSFDLMRLELAGGPLRALVPNASDADLCPDGNRMVYVAFDPTTNSRGALMLAGGAGEHPVTIVTPPPEAQSFMYPRLSPDCGRVVFAAANSTGVRRLAHVPASRRLALLHGSPWEVWTVNIDGSGLTRLTHIAEDEPFPQWSADGLRLLILGTNALYELNADGSGLRQLSTPGVSHGQIAWLRPPAAH